MKKKITWDFFKDEVLPNIHAKADEGYQTTVTAYLAAKSIELIGEDGNPIDLESQIVFAPPAKVEEKATATVEEDADIETVVTKAVEKAVKEMTRTEKAVKPVVPQEKAWGGIPATVKRYGRVKNFKGTVNGFTADERAYRFGQWCLAVAGFDKSKAFCDRVGIKLHQENVNTTGGYLVPEEFGTDMIDLRETFGAARRVLKIVPMMSDTRSDPRRTGGLTASFVAEGAILSESTKSWDRVDLTAKKLACLSRITTELNEDASINVGDDLASEIAYAFSNKEDDCAFNGDGSATYGGIVGFRSRLATINGVDDGGGLVLGSGNLWTELTMADFHKTIGRLPQYADTPRAAWVCHRAFYFGVMQRLEQAAGGTLSQEIVDGTRGRFKFEGYPVEISQVMPSSEANSQIPVTFGDHSLAASFGDRRQDTIAFTTEGNVGGQNAFEYDFIGVRGTERFDINVHDVGSSTVAGPVVGLITAAS